jgi:pyruvate kinase
MPLVKITPRIAMADFKRTKIIASLGSSSNSYEMILGLISMGVNGLILDGQATLEDRQQQLKWIRQASQELGKPVAVIHRLAGPKLKLGDFEGILPIQKGQTLKFRHQADYSREGVLPIASDFSDKIRRGQRLLLASGQIRSEIMGTKDKIIHSVAQNDGVLLAHQNLHLPDSDFAGDVITTKDRQDLAFISTSDVDYVIQDFVQTAEDVGRLARLLQTLNCSAKIMANMATKASIDNLETIAEQADALLVDREALAIQISPERVPLLQRQIINLGLKYHKPSIVAAQVLAAITDSLQPTGAEVNDIAATVLAGTDALLLNKVTASGRYPVEAIRLMKRIITTTQTAEIPPQLIYPTGSIKLSPQDAIPSAVIELAKAVKAVAVVAETKSGATALKIAAYRPTLPIIVATSNQRVAQQLAIMYGAMTFVRKDESYQAAKLTDWLKTHRIFRKGDIVVSASGQQAGIVGATDTIMVRAL